MVEYQVNHEEYVWMISLSINHTGISLKASRLLVKMDVHQE